ncbi:uncharacterized protein LOC135843990 [Planococcus citri]|uniref:uncharacterized protein LOC135843990 n=1 Tax=Planococcus citri TaxID=170843 RepID=UPI0031F86DCB
MITPGKMTPKQTHCKNETVQSHEDRFVYHYNVPSLQEIASYRVAGTILESYFSKHLDHLVLEEKKPKQVDPSFSIFSFNFHYEKHAEELVGYLRTPRCIDHMLKTCLKKLGEELQDWALQFQSLMFPPGIPLRRKYQILGINPNWCVWSMNGEIDHRKTVQKVLNTSRLTEMQKFLVMCEYFMEDEIKKVSLDSLSLEFISEADFNTDPIRSRWICYLKNDLSKISDESYASLKLAIAMKFKYNITFANEYFWNQLNDDEDQVRIAGNWISWCLLRNGSERNCVILEKIISAMSSKQQNDLLFQKAETIVVFFSIYPTSSQCAFWAWRKSRDEMTLEQFAKIVSDLLQENENAINSLNKIWDTAYDHQRNFVVRTKSDEFVEKFFLASYNLPMVSEFLYKFFQTMPLSDRKKLIFGKPHINIYWCDPRSLNMLLNVCLPNSDDRSEFKKLIMESPTMRTHCRILFLEQEFEKLNQILEIFSLDDFAARKFKQELLKEEWTRYNYLSMKVLINHWDNLSKFIDQAFENDLSSATKMKQIFISNFAANIKHEYYSDVRDGFDDVVKIVEMVFKNGDELNDVKRQFSRSFLELLVLWRGSKLKYRFDHDVKFAQKLKKWCFVDGDEESILRFDELMSQYVAKVGKPVRNSSRRVEDDHKLNLFSLSSFFRNIFSKMGI